MASYDEMMLVVAMNCYHSVGSMFVNQIVIFAPFEFQVIKKSIGREKELLSDGQSLAVISDGLSP